MKKTEDGTPREIVVAKRQFVWTKFTWDELNGCPLRGERRLGNQWRRGVCVGQGNGMAVVLKDGFFQWGIALTDKVEDTHTIMRVVAKLLGHEKPRDPAAGEAAKEKEM